MTGVRRAARRFTLGSGPLKRGTDRIQVFLRIWLLLAVLAAVPAGVWVATVTHRHLSSVATEQARTRHATYATLLEDAASSVAPDPTSNTYAAPVATATASWVTSAGTVRVGHVPAPVGTRAGAAVRIWVTAGGNRTVAPLDPSSIAQQTGVIATVTSMGIGLSAWGLYGLVARRLARRRDRQWGDGWAAVGPIWTAQLH